MARKTRRRSRSRRRRRQKGGDSEAHTPEVEAEVDDAGEVEASPGEAEVGSLLGGRRRKRKSKKSKKTRKKRRTRKKGKKGKKRGLNGFFKLMLDAKKKGLASFKYKGKTYKGRKHNRLGMIYKKA